MTSSFKENLITKELRNKSNETITIPILGTNRNLIIITAFYLFFTIGYAIAGAVGLIWYISKWHMSLLWLNNAGLLNTVASTYTSIYVGYYGDKVKSKWGRRKLVVSIGVLILAVSSVAICFPPSHDSQYLALWFTMCHIFTGVGYNVFYTPFTSWMLESCADGEDYRRIQTIATTIGYAVGGVIGTGATVYFLNYAVILFVVGLSISFSLLMYYIPSNVNRKIENQPDLIPSVRTCMQTQEFQILFINKILLGTAVTSFGTAATYLQVVGFKQIADTNDLVTYVLVAFLAVGLGGMAASILLNWVLKYVEKLWLYQCITLIAAFLGVVAFFACMTSGTFVFFFLIVIILGILYVPATLIDGLLVRDLVVLDTFTTGLNRENMYQVAINLPSNLITILLSNLPLIVIYASGFKVLEGSDDDSISSQYSWTDTTLWELRMFCSFFLTAVALLAYWSIRRYKISDQLAETVNACLKAREAKAGMIDDSVGLGENWQAGPGPGVVREVIVSPLAGGPNTDERESQDQADEAEEALERHRLARLDDELFGSIADNKDEMLMLNFSYSELSKMAATSEHLAETAAPATAIKAVHSIANNNVIGLILGSLAFVSITVGVIMQLDWNINDYSTLLIVIALLVSVYILYETLRRQPIQALIASSDEDIRHKAEAALQLEQTRRLDWRDFMIAHAHALTAKTTPPMSTTANMTTTHESARDSLASNGDTYKAELQCTGNAAAPAPVPDNSNTARTGDIMTILTGYGHVFAILVAVIVIGILAATRVMNG